MVGHLPLLIEIGLTYVSENLGIAANLHALTFIDCATGFKKTMGNFH